MWMKSTVVLSIFVVNLMADTILPIYYPYMKASGNSTTNCANAVGPSKEHQKVYNLACAPYKTDPHTRYEDDTHVLRERLSRFVSCLKTYVDETSFDVKRFRADTESLSATLVNISSSVESATQTHLLDNQMRFTLVMFRSMIVSADKIRFYQSEVIPAYRYISKVIEVGIRSFVLFDAKGKLDTRIEAYVGELKRLRGSLDFWTERFRKLPFVRMDVRLIYETEYNRADETLNYLSRQISK